MNVRLRHSLGSPRHLSSNVIVTLTSPQIKLAMSFHLWLASLIIRSLCFFPLSVYLSISNSSNVGNSSMYKYNIQLGQYMCVLIYTSVCIVCMYAHLIYQQYSHNKVKAHVHVTNSLPNFV